MLTGEQGVPRKGLKEETIKQDTVQRGQEGPEWLTGTQSGTVRKTSQHNSPAGGKLGTALKKPMQLAVRAYSTVGPGVPHRGL